MYQVTSQQCDVSVANWRPTDHMESIPYQLPQTVSMSPLLNNANAVPARKKNTTIEKLGLFIRLYVHTPHDLLETSEALLLFFARTASCVRNHRRIKRAIWQSLKLIYRRGLKPESMSALSSTISSSSSARIYVSTQHYNIVAFISPNLCQPLAHLITRDSV